MSRFVRRNDKALNANLHANGVVSGVFGQDVYIRWDGNKKSTLYEKKTLVWFEKGSSWSVPFSESRSTNG